VHGGGFSTSANDLPLRDIGSVDGLAGEPALIGLIPFSRAGFNWTYPLFRDIGSVDDLAGEPALIGLIPFSQAGFNWTYPLFGGDGDSAGLSLGGCLNGLADGNLRTEAKPV
jgi:hypothetical protein